MPEVSVVIPTRNRQALLSRTLASVLWQRDVDLEVVVVDDCSTDDTSAMLRRLADSRVRVVRQEVRSGVSAARNRGIRESVGEWIAFLDDDDLWAPDKLAKQLRSAQDASAGWVFGGSVMVTADLTIVAGGPPPSPESAQRHMSSVNMVPAGASNVVAHRTFLENTGPFDLKLRHLADWDMWIRLAHLGPPAVVPEPLLAYVIHTGNASFDTAEAPLEMMAIEERYRHLRGTPRIDRAAVHRWIAWNKMRVGERSKAVMAYARAAGCGHPRSIGSALLGLVWPDAVWHDKPWRRDNRWWEAAGWLRELQARPAPPSTMVAVSSSE